MSEQPQGERLHWESDRWHLGAHGIHAGDIVEVWCPWATNGADCNVAPRWVAFRVESEDSGRSIFLVTHLHGLEFRRRLTHRDGRMRMLIDLPTLAMRWPEAQS